MISRRRRATSPSMPTCAGVTRAGACAGLADVEHEAMLVGLAFVERVAMPANNLMLVFERTPDALA